MKMGAMRGPKSFEVAAEFSDGCHHALSYTREAYEYMIEHCTIGAERAGKNVQDLDIGAWVVFAVAEDSAMAKDAARAHGRPVRVVDAARAAAAQRRRARGGGADHRGDRGRRHGQGIELTTPDLAERLSVAGTPGGVRGEDEDPDRGRPASTT